MKICRQKVKIYCLLFTVCCLLFTPGQLIAESEFIQVPSVIHVHSNLSDGKHSIEEIAQIAERKGIKSIIFSDHALMRWEYGLWPLQNILKKRVDKNSVLKFGAKKYFQEMEKLQEKYPGTLFLTGVESAPFYYWSGKHFKYHLTLHNWHKHLLIAGLKDSEDYEDLPLVSNPNAGTRGLRSIVLFWPIGLLAIGYWLLASKKKREITYGNQVLVIYSSKDKILGIIIILAGFLFLLNNYPYKYFPYDQYHGEKGSGPYQNLINYVNTKGGIIFWAHPEAPNWNKPQEVDSIFLQTPTYEEDLLRTENYTGFAVFYEGYKKIGIPGGIWDQILLQYCRGTRNKPVWTVGELDYKAEGYLGTYLDSIQNILLIPTNLHENKQESRISTNGKDILECLRNGRFYVLRKTKNDILRLEGFKIETEEEKATIGEEIKCLKPPKIKIKIKIENELPEVLTQAKIKLIRGGEIVKIFEQILPADIEYIDHDLPTGRNYYRLEISGADCGIITNPIFVMKLPAS